MVYHLKILIPTTLVLALSACKPGVYADFTPGKSIASHPVPVVQPTTPAASKVKDFSTHVADHAAQTQEPVASPAAEPFVPAGEKLNLIIPG